MQNQDKLKIVVSSNVPTDKALNSFHNQLYKILLNTDKKNSGFPPNNSKAVKIS